MPAFVRQRQSNLAGLTMRPSSHGARPAARFRPLDGSTLSTWVTHSACVLTGSTPRVPPLSHGDSGSLASGVRPSPRVPPWHGDSRSEPGPRSPWQMAGHGTDSDSEATPRIPSGGVPPTLATGSLSEAARTLAVALRCHVRDRRIGLNRDLYTGL